MDESPYSDLSNVCSSIQRYRFRCSIEQSTCLSVTALGNSVNDCNNTLDELWMGTNRKLSDMSCNRRSTDDCELLRRYIETSWSSSDIDQPALQLRMPFRAYCDTFWSLASREDENANECRQWWNCSEEQWQCRNGQCIDTMWVLDGEWDCSDASDEEGALDVSKSHRNSKITQVDELQKRFDALNQIRTFPTICDLNVEFPCLRIDVFDPIANLDTHRPCIRIEQIGDGHVDCYGAIDERNTLKSCNQATMLGRHFKCSSSNDCVGYWQLCSYMHKCPNVSDDGFWCDYQHNLLSASDCAENWADFKRFNGICVRRGLCNRKVECSFGEDEYMCDYQSLTLLKSMPYRQEKELMVKNAPQKLRLYRFPSDANTTEPEANARRKMVTSKQTTRTYPHLNSSLTAYWCNRGVGVQMYNGSTICFCPPQYFGEKCQFHSDRILVLLHLNLSQSIYTAESDRTILLKLLVLLLLKDEIVATHEFHVRPVMEMVTYKKKMVHFVYPRRHASVTDDHSYSIRIEGYELKMNEGPQMIAMWQYSVYFDFLPTFRLAKVLRFTQLGGEINPCSSNPCHTNQRCQPILNSLSKYICFCRGNLTGENCSVKDQSCVEGFCSFGALCKPSSQQLLRGNQLPYCVCPLNRFGERCDVEYDQCASNPCHNGGSCFPTSRPHQFMCLCTDFYYGQRCELRKPRIQLYVNETVHHAGGVVQYFRINFVSLDLILIHQRAYRIFPKFFEYQHNDRTAPEIIVAKLYSSYADTQSKIYLLSLHINVTSIYGTTQMVEKNQCVGVRTLTTDRNPIQYHHLCQISPTVMCFYDQSYLCLCADDHSRVECFGYDHHLDSCPHCRAGGRCLKGNDFICLCPPCHSGSHCQFSSNSFTFTLDQLFFTDLTSAKKRTTVRWLIIAPLLLFFIALPSNLFSLLTFRRRKCLRNGIGQYLFCISIINQISIAFLVARLIHLTASIASFRSHSITDHILCKVFGCFLTCSTRITFWLASFISVERVYTTLFLNKQWLKQPRIARRIIGLTFFITLLLAAYEVVFVKSISREINGHRSNMCVMNFPVSHQSLWMIIHQIVTIINSIFPLLISIICTITMICVLVKKKMNIRQNRDDDTAKTNPVPSTEPQQEQNLVVNKDEKNERNRNRTRIYRLTLLFGVINENKEMIARPAVTLVPAIFSLFTMPHLIVSFSLGCQNLENSPLRYLLIASYFLSFVPQIVTFFLYIYPSSLYWNEWCETPIGTCISRSSQQRPLQTMTAVSAQEERSKLQTETPRC